MGGQDEPLFRPATPLDACAMFELTLQSLAGLATAHHSPEQIAGWMADRTPAH